MKSFSLLHPHDQIALLWNVLTAWKCLKPMPAAIIRSRALGPIRAMGSEVIQELLGAFPGFSLTPKLRTNDELII